MYTSVGRENDADIMSVSRTIWMYTENFYVKCPKRVLIMLHVGKCDADDCDKSSKGR